MSQAFLHRGPSRDSMHHSPRPGQASSSGEGRPGFDRRMTREEINALPLRRSACRVRVVASRDELGSAAERLLREKVLGFDVETRPCFRRGERHPPALLQLAGGKGVYLFRLAETGLPRNLRRILSSPRIIKAGVAPADDILKLQEIGAFRPAGFVDLSAEARAGGIKNHGLRGLAAVLLGYRISKGAQRSNWARKVLTASQIAYAATDAWVSRELYLRLQSLGPAAGGGKRGTHAR